MFKFFRKISFSGYKIILGTVIFVLITVGILLYWRDSLLVEQAAAKATELKLLVLARAGARSTEVTLSMFKVELAILSRKEEIKNQNIVGARQLLDNVISTVDPLVSHQFALTSKDGLLLVVANKEGKTDNEGISLEDRDYFQWAKNAKEGEFFIGEPRIEKLVVNQGEWVVILATPVIKDDGSFNGCLFAPVRLDELTLKYIDSLKTSPTTIGFVINKEGIVLSSQFKELIGVNIREYTQREKWQGYETYLSFINQMVLGEEGNGVYYFAGPDKNVGKWVGSFSSARISGNTITIATAVPFTWTYSLVADFYKAQTLWLAFIIIIGITIAFFWIIGMYLVRRDGYERGLRDGSKIKK
jgi:hypothetical protein